MSRLLVTTCAASLLFGCGPSAIITETAPFDEVVKDLASSDAPSFVRSSQDFAKKHDLEIIVNEFADGTFSVVLHDKPPPSINLIALNTVNQGKVDLSAIASGMPTARQQQLAKDFFQVVPSAQK